MTLIVRPMGANLTRDTEVFGRMVIVASFRIPIALLAVEDRDK